MSGLVPSPTHTRPGRWRRGLIVAVVALTSILGIGSAAAQPQQVGQAAPVINPQARAADLARPAVVWIRIHFDAWVITPFGTFNEPVDYGCTGFVVNPAGYIVTAGHCVDDGMDGAQGDAIAQVVDQFVEAGAVPVSERDRLIEDVKMGNIDWQVEGQDNNSRPDRTLSVTIGAGNVRWKPKITANARLVEFLPWKDGDVALLKVAKSGLPSILLSPTDDIQIGEELLSIGYPAATDGEESFGLTNRNGQINAELSKGPSNLTFYETSANLTSGQSGGPTVDLNGQVVGMASFKNEDANYIVPASIIRELISRNGVRNELGRIDELYRQGLESYYRGEYSAAIDAFDQVLGLLPGHKQASAKKTKAAELRERFGDPRPPAPPSTDGPSTIQLLAGAAAALVLLVLVLTTGLLLRRRSRRRRPGRLAPSSDPFAATAGWDGTPLPPAHAHDAPDGVVAPAARYRTDTPAGPDGDRIPDGAAQAATPVSVRTSEAAGPRRNFCSQCGARVQTDDPSCQQCGAWLT
jgi:serine protease Do